MTLEHWKTKFLNECTYIGYVIAKLLKLVQMSMAGILRFFLKVLLKLKRAGDKFPGHLFHRNFFVCLFVL